MPRSPSASLLEGLRGRFLRRADLPPDTVALAQYLLGKLLVRTDGPTALVARIVETEAYVVGDAASHAFRGPTARNGSMYLARGYAYVYFIYGSAYCLNVSSERAGTGAAVLLRAAEPIAGLAEMRRRRPGAQERDLLRGPGRLAAGFGVDRDLDGLDLCAPGPLRLAADASLAPPIGTSPRIGLRREAERPLRFYVSGSRHLSGPRALSP